MEELERVQSVVKLVAQILSLDVSQSQAEIDIATTLNDMDSIEREALEKAILQSVIEASLIEADDDIIEINLGVAPLRPKPVSDVDEQLFVPQSNIADEDMLR